MLGQDGLLLKASSSEHISDAAQAMPEEREVTEKMKRSVLCRKL